MGFNLFKRPRKDEEEGKREEWLRDLGFEESYGNADADKKDRQKFFDAQGVENEKILRQRFDRYQSELMDERMKRQAWAQERCLPFVDLDRITPDPYALHCLSGDMARQHQVVPVKREGINLWLAMANAGNFDAVDAVREATHCRIHPVVAMPDAVRDAIEWHYPPEAEGRDR